MGNIVECRKKWTEIMERFESCTSFKNEKKTVVQETREKHFELLGHISQDSEEKILMRLATAVSIVLNKYSLSNVMLGIQSETKKYIPVHVQFDKDISIKELLETTQKEYKAVSTYQNFNIRGIANKLGLAVQTIQDFFVIGVGLENEPLTVEEQRYECVLKLDINERKIKIYYQSPLYTETEINNIAKQVNNVFMQIQQSEDELLSKIKLLDEAEKRQILEEFNGTIEAYDTSVIRMFMEQVEKTPDKISLKIRDKSITYIELDQLANGLCNKLIANGVTTGNVVAFMCNRSIEMAIGMLGIMKAGAIYLPLDPNLPKERIQYILQDSCTTCIVTDYANKDKVSEYQIKTMEFTRDELQKEDIAHGKIGAQAYIIYTSGSTGQPKGVLVGHKNIASSIGWRKQEYNLDTSDNVLQLFSYVFDGFMTSFLTPLVSGSTIVFVEEEEAKNVVTLRRIIEKEQITHFIAVPALCLAIYEDITVEEAASVRIITVAGDKIIQELVEQIRAKNIHTELVNEYGPTECSVVATIKRHAEQGQLGSIGKPIQNVKIYIMDEYGNLLPEGVSGEIVITGNGVALGYINRPDLTEEKFVSDPYGTGKMYKTGDKGRWLANGEIEFLGRIDHQVKIRGYRIELQEIEQVIESLDNVKIGAVVAEDDNLYAFYTGTEEINGVSNKLESLLPQYMLPRRIIKLDKMPLTSNGKINYKRLKVSQESQVVEKVLPANSKEEEMLGIWKKILGNNEIGVTDNFFEIGGNSLLGIRLVSKITQSMKKDVTLSVLMKNPTVRSFVNVLDEIQDKNTIYIEKASNQELYELTKQQQGIYISSKLDDTGISYNVPTVIKVEGQLDLEKVKMIANELIRRHKSLRTIYINTEDGVRQSVLPEATIKVEDIRNDKDIEGVFKDFLRPFDLEKAPLLRMGVAVCDDIQYLLFDSHHIAVDGVSMGLLYSEFCELYKGNQLAEQPIEFIDYAVWEKSEAAKQLVAEQMKYWVNQFKDGVSHLNLPTDFPRSSMTGMKGKTIHFYTSPEETKVIKEFCSKYEITPYMLLVGTYGLLLQKYTGSTDITVGFPSYGRYLEQLQNMIGMFVNSLPIRLYPTYEKSFEKLLKEIKESVLESLSNQACGLDDIIGELGLSSENGVNPLFNTMFAYHDIEMNTHQIEGLNLTPIEIEQNMVKFDMTIDAQEEIDRLHFTLRYNVNLFKKETMNLFVKHFMKLLNNVLLDPTIPIGKVPMLLDEEYHQIVVENNAVASIYKEKDNNIKTLFEQQVRLNPQAIAVAFADQTLTYEEVNNYSNALARKLADKKVHKGSIVPIIADRSLELLIIEMAIMKNGAIFCPVDPNWPAARINMIVEEVGAEFIVVHSKSEVIDEVEAPLYQVTLEELEPDTENLNIEIQSQDAIYIIYTSGSSGKPKGVEVPYRGIMNRLMWMNERLGREGCNSVLNTTNYVYDSSVWQLYWPLINGGKVVIPEPNTIMTADYLLDIIHKEQVTITDFVPSVFNVIVKQMQEATLSLEALNSLKWLIIGGEEIKPKAVKAFKELFPNVQCINLYGPTEASIGCIYKVISGDEQNVIPIGKPISNVSILILDEAMMPVPKGVIGQIYIGGICLANGYYHDEEKTRNAFVKNPFKEINSEYLYKTGDIAKWGDDWDIYFLGRCDYQVKIRGFRIELQEIESKILEFAGVRECVVVDYENEQGDKYLSAYFTASEAIEADEVKAYLTSEMPNYMVPTFIIKLDEMPIASSGKVDRKQLPKPDFSTLVSDIVLPRTEEEQILAEVWKEVLHLEEISIYDNFFAIGGDSIKALQIASHLKKRNIEFTMQKLFMYPTIEQLAQKITYAEVTTNERLVGEVPLSPIQKRFFTIYDSNEYFNQAVLLVNEKWNIANLEKAFEHVVDAHDLLRAKFEKTETGRIKQVVVDAVDKCFVLETFDITQATDEKKEVKAIVEEVHSKIKLEDALIRLALIKTKDAEHLMMCMHHLIVDGVSWHIILEDFIAAYEALEQGTNISDIDRSKSYKDYVKTLEEYSKSKGLQGQIEYWRNVANTKQNNYGLFGDKKNFTLRIDAETSNALLKDIHSKYHTQVNDVLLTVLALAFNKLDGSESLTIDLESMGRNLNGQAFEYMKTVGWFTALYPVKLQVTKGNIERTLCGIKEGLRKVPDSGIGYNVLKYYTDYLEGYTDSEISFNYMGEMSLGSQIDGKIKASSYDAGSMISPKMKMGYGLDINAKFENNELVVSFDYTPSRFTKEQIARLAENYDTACREVVSHCLQQGKSKKTPSDFGQYKLSLEELEEIYKSIDAEKIEKVYPLSPMQSGMLFHALLDKQSKSYFEQNDVTFTGKLDLKYFKTAYEMLLQTYDVFRTVFIYNKLSQPYQVVKNFDQDLVRFEVEDISAYQDKDELINTYCELDRAQGFDLQEGPLMRVHLFKLDETTYRVIWSDHHILMDGWCIAIVLQKFFEYYECLAQDRNVSCTVNHQYQEYINWLIKQDTEQAKEYWTQKLETYDVPVTLYKKEVLKPEYVQHRHRINLSKVVSEQISNTAKENGFTLNAAMQAGWATTLMKYVNTEDVVFGTVVSGRPAVIDGIEDMVGLFINTLPVRMSANKTDSFIELVQKAQNEFLDAEQFSYYPLASVQACSPLGNELFSHIFVFENHPMKAAMESLSSNPDMPCITAVDAVEQTNYDLNIIVTPGEEIIIDFVYNENVYESWFIEQIARHYVNILEMVSKDLKIAIEQVKYLDDQDYAKLLGTFNGEAANYPQDANIISLFKEQVQSFGDRVAISCEERDLSYKEVDELSDNIATYLIQEGIQSNDIIGLLMEKSEHIVVAALGVLKAGGAYMPLDPTYPIERINFMIEDSKAKVVLVNEVYEDITKASKLTNLQEIMNVKGQYKSPTIVPNDTAYIIYTSGTTGQPKGVMVSHKNVVRLMINDHNVYDFNEHDVWTMFHSFCFDFSVWEMYGPLLFGGRLIVIPKAVARDIIAFTKLVSEEKVTVLNQTPTAFRAFADYTVQEKTELALRYVIFGGEALQPATLKAFHECYAATKLINMYGITETTVHVTFKEIGDYEIENNISNVGKPIPTLNVHIVDRNMELLPIGMPGEMLVSGDGVTKGYINRAELTAQRFIDWEYEEGKTYRSGDLARYLPSGDIEYLGRIDQQVKIRGHRIELGEIKSALMKCEDITDAAVISVKDKFGNNNLCAYYVAQKVLNVEELRNLLLEFLPQYMIPAHFMRIESIPMTVNGKLNVKALPVPEMQGEKAEYIAAENEIQQAMVEVWEEVLEYSPISITDNYFVIGGDSIKAIQIYSRLNARGIQFKIKDLFEYSTIQEISKHISLVNEEYSQEEVTGTSRLTAIQKWLIETPGAKQYHYNQPIMFYAQEGFDAELIKQTIYKLSIHHDILRSRFVLEQDEIIQVYDEVESTAKDINVFDLRNQEVEDEITQYINEREQSVQLFNSCLYDVSLFKTDKGDHLLFVVHHMIIDAVSWRILVEDFISTYEALLEGKEVSYPQKTLSFKAWSESIYDYAHSARIKTPLKYWLAQEHQVVDKLFKVTQDYGTYQSTKTIKDELSEEQTQALLTKVHKAYKTSVEEILLAALIEAIANVSDCHAVRVDIEGHGRENIFAHSDVSRTLGWFTAIYPVVLRKDTELKDLICNVKEQIRQVPNKGVDYGIIKYLTAHGNKLSDEAQISFNYLGQIEKLKTDAIALSDLSIGDAVSPDLSRKYALDISCKVENGRLKIAFDYTGNLIDSNLIENLMVSYKRSINRLCAHCLSQSITLKTPSDYALPLTMDEFNKHIVSKLEQIENIYLLTPMQKGMLYHAILQPDSDAYYEKMTMKLSGQFNAEKFEKVLRYIQEKFEILRTGILHQGLSVPVQVVYKKGKLDYEYIDYSNYEKTQQQELISQNIQPNFDFENGKLSKMTVIKLDEEAYIWIWQFHHLILDGWSVSIVLEEIFKRYMQLQNGESIRVEEINKYGEIVKWLGNKDIEVAKAYWEERLAGYDTTVSLTNEKNTTQYELAEETIYLTEVQTNSLKELASTHNVTLSTIVQTIWGILLQRLNGTDDVVFGTVVSGRPKELFEAEQVVGMFINSMPIRLQAVAEVSFAKLIEEFQNQFVTSEEYSYCPIYEVQSCSELKEKLMSNVVAFENYPVNEKMKQEFTKDKCGFEVEEVIMREHTEYQFGIVFTPSKALKVNCTYNKNAFDSQWIKDVLNYYANLVTQVIAQPEMPIGSLSITSALDKNKILNVFNKPIIPNEYTVIEMFEEQVSLKPDAEAIRFAEESLTYRELNRRANGLSNALVESGIAQGDVVALMCQRSIEMAVAILGIMKSGAIYLPIDGELPHNRQVYMLQNSNAKMIVADAHYIVRAKELHENVMDIKAGVPAETTKGQVGEDAYIIYTSGSTGKPKGVLVSHKQIGSSIKWRKEAYKFNDSDCILQLFSYIFDGFMTSFFTPLVSGAKVVFVSEIYAKDVIKLREIIEEEQVTHFIAVPALCLAIYNDLSEKSAEHIRYITTAGDRLISEILSVVKAKNPQTEIINEYGPTECSVVATAKRNVTDQKDISIGKPIDGAQIYIVDTRGNLLPEGVAGEIVIAGNGVAKGYVGNKALTEEKFKANPYAEGRMYFTGDKGKWTSDGEILFVGRIDDQVKIRGYRIELQEIENVLESIDAIQNGAVKVIEDEIYGYYTSESELSEQVIIEKMQQQLPTYMIPKQFIRLDEMPLTRNGKVDHKALPEVKIYKQVEFTKPTTDLEKEIWTIWQTVLEHDQFGVEEYFFEIGGNSIKLMSVQSEIDKRYPGMVSVADLFAHPTIKQLSDYIESKQVSIQEKTESDDFTEKLIEKLSTDEEIDLDALAEEILGMN